MVYVDGVPAQPPTVGVTVMVPLIGVEPELVAVKEGTFPLPLAPRPMAVLEFVHVNDPPAGELLNEVAPTTVPLHTLELEGTVTVGVGLTVMV